MKIQVVYVFSKIRPHTRGKVATFSVTKTVTYGWLERYFLNEENYVKCYNIEIFFPHNRKSNMCWFPSGRLVPYEEKKIFLNLLEIEGI